MKEAARNRDSAFETEMDDIQGSEQRPKNHDSSRLGLFTKLRPIANSSTEQHRHVQVNNVPRDTHRVHSASSKTLSLVYKPSTLTHGVKNR